MPERSEEIRLTHAGRRAWKLARGTRSLSTPGLDDKWQPHNYRLARRRRAWKLARGTRSLSTPGLDDKWQPHPGRGARIITIGSAHQNQRHSIATARDTRPRNFCVGDAPPDLRYIASPLRPVRD